MAQVVENTMSRIDIRLPIAVRDIIDRAANMQGRTRTDFLVEAVLEKAKKVISEQNIIELSMQDQDLLVKALLEEKIVEPTPFIKSIAEEYNVRVQNK